MSAKQSNRIALAVLAGILQAVVAAAPAFAAPDDKLGMAILSARVATDGTLVIGSGTSGQSLKPSTGTYQVFFDRDVSGCVYAATPYYTMQVSAEGLGGAANGVLVNMTNSAGTLTDGGFDLIVYCAQ